MDGIVMRIRDESVSPQFIADVYKITRYIQAEAHYRHVNIIAKSYWSNTIDKVERLLQTIDKESIFIVGRTNMCGHDGCYEPTADYDCPALSDGFLEDRHGEEPHDVHQYCHYHISPQARRMLKTLEVTNLTPDKPVYWTKVMSWQGPKHWYSQQIWVETDGDWEVGYVDCSGASPHLGPFPSREAAIEAARKYEA